MGVAHSLSHLYGVSRDAVHGYHQSVVSRGVKAGNGELRTFVSGYDVFPLVAEYVDRGNQLLPADYVVYFNGELRAFPFALSLAQTDYERTARFGNVSWVYEYDCHLFHIESDGADQLFGGARYGIFGQCGVVLLYM